MLGLYIDTIIIGHKLNSTLRILNELPLQKELQNFMTNDALRKKQQQQNKKTKLKILARAGNQTQDLMHRSRMRYL